MSYCRISEDSDVYLIHSVQGKYEVTLKGGKHWVRKTPEDVLSLLFLIREAGYTVPECATQRLAEEILRELK